MSNTPFLTAPDAVEQALLRLQKTYGERLNRSRAVREQHARGEGLSTSLAPDAVIWPLDKHEVCDILACCHEFGVPLIAFGAGSSLEGHVSAPHGGICMDLSRMDAVLAVHAEDGACVVQPGLTREALNAHLKGSGLFFSVDPGANATIGGMVSTGASGTTTLHYGSMAANVMALELALADGRLVRLGTRARKSSAGYDFVRLVTGAEGTLGVITEITLRIYPLPEAVSAAICSFPSIEAAVRTTIQVIQMGIPIARVELIDSNTVRMVNTYAKLGLREEPMLLMEFHGSPTGVKEQAETVQAIASEMGGNAFEWASTPEERTRLWTARHNAYFAAVQSRPGCKVISTDTCVPISRLADCLLDSVAEADASGIPYFLVGHVGDGNFHFGYLLDPARPEERVTAEQLNHQLVTRALALEGTCTGEHGVGLHKMDFLVTEAGAGAVDMMRTIKRALDPDNIMNPGKIFAL